MISVLSGFLTIWIVIGAGWLLAHLGVLDTDAQVVLSKVTFHIGSPALLLTMMLNADLKRIFAANLLVTISATVLAATLYLIISSLIRRDSIAQRVLGAYGASYVNAANLGIPIAAYVLKDVTWVAPILLFQVVVLQPVGLSLLDADTARDGGTPNSWKKNLRLPFTNPMTVATMIGLALNLLNWKLPSVLANPIGLLGDLAVPCMLVAFGLSLRLGPLPGRGEETAQSILASVIKLIVQPAIAFGLARAFNLDPAATLAVTVIAGLPTAQNIFVYAVRYNRAVTMVRDIVFITTIASIPTITAISALVHS